MKDVDKALAELHKYADAASRNVKAARAERDLLRDRLDDIADLELTDRFVAAARLLDELSRKTPAELAMSGPPPF